jgi:hypothetical protein
MHIRNTYCSIHVDLTINTPHTSNLVMNNEPVKNVVYSYPGPLVCSDLRLGVVVFLTMLIHRAQVQIMCQLTSCMSESTQHPFT